MIVTFYKKHVLFVYIVKQNKNNSRLFTKNFGDFQTFKKFNDDRILMETNIWNFDDNIIRKVLRQNLSFQTKALIWKMLLNSTINWHITIKPV